MPSKIKIQIRAELRDPQGKLIKRLPWKNANSLLKQFIQGLGIQAQQSAITVKATDNTDNSLTAASDAFAMNGLATVTDKGIVIGTGTDAVTMTDYKLKTQVTTNITHAVTTFAVENPDANTYRLAITRVFTNNTGASLGIREVAIYGELGASAKRFCFDHTLYSVDVPNGVGVTLTYRITVTL